MKQILTVAGSDSGGGAGIQADIKAISANGGYAMSVVTAITAQNTRAVTAVQTLAPSLIEAQLDAVFDDFDVAAVKTGMLASSEIVACVADALGARHAANVVVDPVMISKSGHALLAEEAVASLRDRLLPHARVVTPNAHEAALLTGLDLRSVADAREAARRIMDFGCGAVIVKGGHLDDEAQAVDVLYDGSRFEEFASDRVETTRTHGTGCTYSAALATFLGQGDDLVTAVSRAKEYITGAIANAPDIGHGHGPTLHFWRTGR